MEIKRDNAERRENALNIQFSKNNTTRTDLCLCVQVACFFFFLSSFGIAQKAAGVKRESFYKERTGNCIPIIPATTFSSQFIRS